jgi:hypothetical protein
MSDGDCLEISVVEGVVFITTTSYMVYDFLKAKTKRKAYKVIEIPPIIKAKKIYHAVIISDNQDIQIDEVRDMTKGLHTKGWMPVEYDPNSNCSSIKFTKNQKA